MTQRFIIERAAQCALCVLVGLSVTSVRAVPLLPDLIPWADQENLFMYGGLVSTSRAVNRTVYNFTATTANIGPGVLELRNTGPNVPQEIFQRIYDSDGGMTEQLIGSFSDAFQVDNRKQYLPGFSRYNLRTVLPGDGVGPIVSTQHKTSRAVVDSTEYDPVLAGPRVYNNSTANILGISVNWADVYGMGQPGQWVDITHLTPGDYWLEMIVDPLNRIQEANETNNTAQIKITIQSIPSPQNGLGDYDLDHDVDAADYIVWRNTLGMVVTPSGAGADGDSNNRVDAADYDVWRSLFGTVYPGSGTAAVVPEPATATLLLGLVFVLVARRRNRSGV